MCKVCSDGGATYIIGEILKKVKQALVIYSVNEPQEKL